MTGTIDIRVRYNECDPMGFAHHAVYPVWFEMGRTELLRETGIDYRELESQGVFLAVVSFAIKYKRPAHYDDALTLETTLKHAGRVKIEHEYALRRGVELLTTGSSVLACIDRAGKLRAVPNALMTSR